MSRLSEIPCGYEHQWRSHVDMNTKRRPAVAAEHWNLTQEQQVAAARLTRADVELLTIAAELGGLEIGELGPGFVPRLVDAHFLLVEPGVHGRAVARITKNGLAALRFKQGVAKRWLKRRGER
jgi:hypothetical protein